MAVYQMSRDHTPKMNEQPLSEVRGVTAVPHEVWCFTVTSLSRPHDPPYRVELDAYDFNGQCPCKRFTFSLQKRLEAGARPGDKYRCNHLKRAWTFWMERQRQIAALRPKLFRMLTDMYSEGELNPETK